ncbi:MAG: MarR family transcriptional regulator [Gemmatimonadota bacterium]|jgi:MarR family 2-MHQ and catechol resistance regulon transcriptional repressor
MSELQPTGREGENASRDWPDEQRVALGLWVALARCYSTFGKAIVTKITEHDLTVPQFGTLEALYHLGPLTLGELADKLLVTGGNVTYVMDRLEARGLVARYRSEEDRRVVHAQLTADGRELISNVFPIHAEHVQHLCRHLDGREQEDLRRLLKTLGRGIAGEDLQT